MSVEVLKKAIGIHLWADRCLVVLGLLLHAVHAALNVHVVEGSSCRYHSVWDEVVGLR